MNFSMKIFQSNRHYLESFNMETRFLIFVVFVAILSFWFYIVPSNDEKAQSDLVLFEKLEASKNDKEVQNDFVDLKEQWMGKKVDELYAKLMKKDEEEISILDNAEKIIKSAMNEYGLSLNDVRNAVSINFSSIDGMPKDKRTRSLLLLNQGIAQMEQSELTDIKIRSQHSEEAFLYDRTEFNNGILAIGIRKFLSVAVSFCEKVAHKGTTEIISVGSGDGAIEEEIIQSFLNQFGNDLHITLVDLDPKFKADFKTVDELIEKRPTVIENCVLFIFWPVQRSENDNYDIEAVYKLQPNAVLVVYEAAFGLSGSMSFERLLYDKSLDLPPSKFGAINWLSKVDETNYEVHDYGLNNYLIEEIARQDIFVTPTVGTYIFRMVKLTRND